MPAGTLYIVSTPIGNLEDITLRALRILKEVDIIAVEDTRHSLKLLNYYGISKPLISYWSEREKVRAEEVIGKLKEGFSVALISDAGTPGISDPGAVLIQRAIEEGFRLVSIPGPSALTAAVTMSGLASEGFVFLGFSPAKSQQRQKRLAELSYEQKAMVFYEAPHRIIDMLADMHSVFGDRKVAVVKEVTKLHEEVLRGRISEVLADLAERTIAGEYVIVAEGASIVAARSVDEALGEVRLLMKKGKGRKEAVKMIASEYGLNKRELYERSLDGPDH